MTFIRDNSTYVLVNKKSNTALDLSGTDGHSILGWEHHGGDNQKWILRDLGNNQWSLKNVYNGKYLGLAENHRRDNVPLKAVDDEVAWTILPDKQDHEVFRLFVPGTNFNADLTDRGNTNNGTLVAIWGQWEGTNQTWRFVEA